MGGGKTSRRDFAWQRDSLAWLALGVATYSLSELSLLAPLTEQGTALFWLGSGLTLGVLVMLPAKSWIGATTAIFLFYLASNVNHGISLDLSLTFALANALEAICGAGLISLFTKSTRHKGRAQAGALIVSGVIACSLGAMISIGGLTLAEQVEDISRSLTLWFVADFLGVVLVAPLVISWWPGSWWRTTTSTQQFATELTLGVCLAGVLAYAAFWQSPKDTLLASLLISTFALLVLSSVRLGTRGASCVALFVAIIAVSGTLAGHGPFVTETQSIAEQATHLQIYLAVMCLTGLIPDAVLKRGSDSSPSGTTSAHYPNGDIRPSPTLPATDAKSVLPLEFCAAGDIAAGAAHDFNNFLTAIQGSAQILAADAREDQQELLQDILDASAAARSYTSLLTSLKCEDRVAFEEVNLHYLLKEAHRTLGRLAGTNLSLTIDLPNERETARTDPRQLRHYLFQLVIRARQTVTRGGTLNIRVTTEHAIPGACSLEFACVAHDEHEKHAFRQSLDHLVTEDEIRCQNSIFSAVSSQNRLNASLRRTELASQTTVTFLLQLNKT